MSLELRYRPTGQASGRPMFPSFVSPEQVGPGLGLHDPATWRQMWWRSRPARRTGSTAVQPLE